MCFEAHWTRLYSPIRMFVTGFLKVFIGKEREILHNARYFRQYMGKLIDKRKEEMM